MDLDLKLQLDLVWIVVLAFEKARKHSGLVAFKDLVQIDLLVVFELDRNVIVLVLLMALEGVLVVDGVGPNFQDGLHALFVLAIFR